MSASPRREAIREGWPVLVTSLVIGLAFGVISRQAGLSVIETSGSSMIIFAGAAQFATVGLLQSGAGPLEIGLSVLLINLRHLLMAAAVRPYLGGISLVRRFGLAYILTDEAFAMGIGWFRRGHREVSYYVTFGVGLWAAWNTGTLVGAIFGAGIAEPQRLGIDFAITACFAAIVVLGVRHRADAAVGIAAAIAAGVLRLAGATTTAVVIAGAIAPVVLLLMREPPTVESAAEMER